MKSEVFSKKPKEAMKVIYKILKATKATDCGLDQTSACNAVRKTAENCYFCYIFPFSRFRARTISPAECSHNSSR